MQVKTLKKAIVDRTVLKHLHIGNKSSKKVFTLLTGVKLPDTNKGTKTAIENYYKNN